MLPRVAIMATGAWFDPAPVDGEPERHGNPNVLTLDIGTSRLTQGPSALSALIEIERWDAALPAVEAWSPPRLATQTATNDETFNGLSRLTIATDNR